VPSLTLAHISDLHIGPLPRAGLRALAGKRVTGFHSWRLKRSKIHRLEVLDVLAQDLAEQQPDHIAVTGDLVNIALPAEFTQAHAFLRRIGPAERVTVVPGNHDAYVALPWNKAAGLWDAYMTGRHSDGGDRPPRDVRDFPFVRRIGGVALIGVVTASFAAWFIDRVRDDEEAAQAATQRDLELIATRLEALTEEVRLLRVARGAADSDLPAAPGP
jgi:hypothetical protein